jgi:hypothetical protein
MVNKRKKSANSKKVQKLAKQTNPQPSNDNSHEETGNQNYPKFKPNVNWVSLKKFHSFKSMNKRPNIFVASKNHRFFPKLIQSSK